MDCHPDPRLRYPARRRTAAEESPRRVRPRHQLVEGAGLMRSRSLGFVLLISTALTGCATFKPPQISYDDEQPAVLQADPPKPVQVVELPKPLPLPGQLKPLPGARSATEPRDPRQRIDLANAAARGQPSRAGYVNAVQVFPFAEGALYQVYAAPGQVTDIALQEGEQLVGSGPVAAGDTVRWIIGDTESGPANGKRVHILVKPTRPDVVTNLVITTPTVAPIIWSCARQRRPTCRRCRGSIPRTSLSRFAARMHLPRLRPRWTRALISAACASATQSRATIRPGARCTPSMTDARSTSNFPAALLKARCRRCSSSAPRARPRSS